MFTKIFSKAKQGVKNVAAGRAQANLGIQSPHLAPAVVRVGRFLYSFSAGWIFVSWYSGYVNERTDPGGGPKLILPGTKKKVNSPDRANPAKLSLGGGSSGGGSSNSGSNSKSNNGTGGSVTHNAGKGGGNPFPGATGSRLDQGFDMTSQHFLAPADSKIVFASASVSGWQGGGLVAGLILSGPKKGKVWYMAEGISPVVKQGQTVRAGVSVARPVPNPYNGITGNIEAGWANPASPTQPLAQVSSNKSAVAWDFYNWIRSLGGPTASSTGNAGLP